MPVSEYGETGFVFTDLETTGLYEDKNAIVQIAAIITDLNFKIRGMFSSFVKPFPGAEISQFARDVHGIKDEDLEDAPSEISMLHSLESFCALRPHVRFAGYNIDFDRKFLGAVADRNGGIDAPYITPGLCILALAREKITSKQLAPFIDKTKKGEYTLTNVSRYLAINTDGAHGALADIYMTVRCARALSR